MAMDWTVILSTISAFLTGGFATSFFTRRQVQGVGTADAILRSGEAMEKMMQGFKTQQETFNDIIAQKDGTITQLYLVIGQKDRMIELNEESIKQLKKELSLVEYNQKELERKVRGLQERQNETEAKRIFAEKLACVVKDCPLRDGNINKIVKI